jgi:Xaa-Pro dipeptidase
MTASLPPLPAPLGVLFADHLHRLQSRCLPALAAEGFDSLVVSAGQAAFAFLDDQTYPYRPNPHFAWWVPHGAAAGSLLHIRPGRRPLLLFHAPRDYWHEPPSLPREPWVNQFDVIPVSDAQSARAALASSLAESGGGTGAVAFIGEPFDGRDDCGFTAINPPRLLVRLHDLRTRKTPWELHQHRVASHRAASGHRAAAAAYRGGASEFDIHLAFLSASGAREIELPYGAIVATGAKAATLHYQHLSRGAPGPSLLIDAGVQERGYASDVTRTHAAHDGDFAALLARMEDLQQSLCAAVRPGVDWRDLHQTAHQLLGDVLHDAGITRVESAEAVERGLTRLFLPHGLGHLLGLQVHDVGGFQSTPDEPATPPPAGHPHLRLTRVLEPGFVVTMEPGLYFIDQLLAQARADERSDALDWLRIESLQPCGGIRIEDNLAVTADGCENLTRAAFAAVPVP